MARRSKRKKGSPEVGQVACAEALPGGTWLLQALVIAAAVGWIYAPALHGAWLWDDGIYLTENSLLRDPFRLWKAWFQPGSFVEYYPIEESAQWLQWQLWHNDTFGYHVTNVILHFSSALLVWRLLAKFGLRRAWLGGLLFAIHPVQVESVAWIAEFKNALSLPPCLLAMCAWIDYEQTRRPRDYAFALGWFLAAMLCKISVAPFPAVILLYAWWKRDRIGWSDVKASAPFFVISLVLVLVTALAGMAGGRQAGLPPSSLSPEGPFSRLALAGLSTSFYFSKCFLPVDLMPVYPQWTVNPPSLLQFLILAGWAGAIWWLWRKHQDWSRHALLGLGFFLLFLAPFVGFVSISYMDFTWVMDHFLYIPLIGLIGLVVAAMGQLENRLAPQLRTFGMTAVAIVMVLLAWGSHASAALYADPLTLWSHAVRQNPGAWMAHNNLGYALGKANRIPEALEEFEQCLSLKPDYAPAHSNLGVILKQTGRLPEAMDQEEMALRINPGYAEAHYNLALVLADEGRLTEAIDHYESALQRKPDYFEAHRNLGDVLQRAGRIPEAIDQYEEALRIMPEDPRAHNNLGGALQRAGRLPEAIEHYETALRLDPDFAEPHDNLGNILLQAGRPSEAMDQYEQALRINPSDANARSHLQALQGLQKPVPK